MTKFRTDVTKGGYKILSLHGPDGCDEYAGVVDTGGSYLTITWYDTGVPVSANDLYSLIPLDEPKPDHTADRLAGLEERIEAMERNSVKTDDWAVRVNGDLHAMHNRLLELEKRSQPTDKGVWVTKDRFWGAWCEVNPVGLTSEELLQRIAKRLGLE